jgi:hypothetical protein
MVRIHNPVKGDKNKLGTDGQLHGGMLESADQVINSIFQQDNNGSDTKPTKQK